MTRRRVFRRMTIAALIASPLASVSVASTRAMADEGVAAEALAPGSWSVQFSVQPNLTLGSFSGSTLSLKRHLASGNALRLGVSVSVNSGDERWTDVTGDTSVTRTQLNARDGSYWSLGVGAYYLWYGRRAAPLHVYGGAGPTISWGRRHDDETRVLTQTATGQPTLISTLEDEVRTRAWQVGVAGALGVEWLVARRVGLFAEYGSTLAYAATRSTRRGTITSSGSAPQTDRSESHGHRWTFSGSGGSLGVSAYY